MAQMWISLAVFFVVYAIFVTDTFNRAMTAWLAAMLMVVLGFLHIEEIFNQYIEWQTITLLVSLLILTGYMNETRIFPYLAVRMLRIVKAKPLYIFVLLTIITAIYAALLENVVAILIMVPLVFTITRAMKVNPIPYLIAQIIAANIGGTMSYIGSIPNMMIGGANPQLTFGSFVAYLGPLIVLILVVTTIILVRIYRHELLVTKEYSPAIEKLDVTLNHVNPTYIRLHMLVYGLTILGFFFHNMLHLEVSTIAICGAIILILLRSKKLDVQSSFTSIQWETILIVIGLYAVAGGMQKLDLFHSFVNLALTISEGHPLLTSSVVLWMSSIVSGTLDNMLFITTLIPMIQQFHLGLDNAHTLIQSNLLWWSLILGTGLGGNATLIASPVNLIVLGLVLKNKQNLKYLEFLKVGLPIAIVTLVLAQLYIILRFYMSDVF